MTNSFIGKSIALVGLLSVAFTAQAQSDVRVDENCTISIMNRTVQANSDGSWELPNVPAFMGRVRARANCLVNGQTVAGQTEFFSVAPNEEIQAQPIFFDNITPVPTSLEFLGSTEDILITDLDDTPKLDVVANYSDGFQSDVLDVFSGLNLTSSNPNIVFVDSVGTLSAINSGSVLITARLEGAIALKRVTVLLGGDADGDGLPDDFELAQGLDPNDPFDAMEDQDRDGLSALDEFGLGTDLNLSDTDGDGLEDGEETVPGEDGFITDPLAADTDGDLVNDGLEALGGTDPNDPLSVDFSSALDSINIVQNDFELIFNGVQTEVSRQLQVIGQLLDGTEVDLTDTTLGTSYNSSDISVVSFGLNPGEVFGGSEGVATITASNNGFEDAVDITVVQFDPVPLAALNIPGTPLRVDVAGTYLYISAASAGLQIVDALDPTAPYIASSFASGDQTYDAKVSGNYVYLADGTAGLKVVDVSDPVSPFLAGSYATVADFRDLAVGDEYLAVAQGDAGIEIINISFPDTPIYSGRLGGLGNVRYVDMDLSRDLVVAITGDALHVIDISNRTQPVLVNTFAITSAQDVLLDGNYAYVAARTNGYKVIEISDNFIPTLVSGTDESSRDFIPVEVKIANGLAFFAEIFFVNAVPFVNVEEPTQSVFQGIVDLQSFGDDNGRGLAVDSQYVYLVTDKNRLLIGQYIQIDDTEGVAPDISFTNLADGQVYAEGQRLVVRIDATDDIAVQAVSLTLDGTEVATDTGYPFNITISLPQGSESAVLQASAVDFGGNLGQTEEITLTLKPDTDQDGLIDELEPTYGTNINDADTDDDGLEDGREVAINTDPLNPDTDGDGVPDGVEALQGTDPNSSEERWEAEIVNLTQDTTVSRATMNTATVNSDFALTVTDDFVVQGNTSNINVDALNVQGTLIIDGAELVLNTDSFSAGDVQIINGGVLTVPNTPAFSSGYVSLKLDVDDELFIDGTSSIDVTGKGFAYQRGGPEASSNSARWGCHAGDGSDRSNCAYGRYADVRFGGSGYFATGGGFVSIHAGRLIIDGSLLANGEPSPGGRSGAGGGIAIDVTSLEGAGVISAVGHAGQTKSSGGRISVTGDRSQWTGRLIARGGSKDAGAGTVYLQDESTSLGSLIVNGFFPGQNGRLTQIEHVGRHEITAAADRGDGTWELSVGTTPWRVTDTQLQWGVQGLKVDLDASDESGALYTVDSNTANTLVITTVDDLSGVVGQELIGVHEFEALIVKDGALVDFGGDRVEITDFAGSEISDAIVRNATFKSDFVHYFAQNNIDGVLELDSLNISDLTVSATGLKVSELNVSGALTIDGSELQMFSTVITPNDLDNTSVLSVSGNIDILNGGVLTVQDTPLFSSGYSPLRLDVTGDVYVDVSSSIDVTGKGFAYQRGGPEASSNSARWGCHAGDGSDKSNCAYGRYADIRFGGSGYFAAGGGFVSIKANRLIVDGAVLADGESSSASRPGAGGGISIEVASFEGTGLISAKGLSGQRSSSGGRIHIMGDRSQWSGGLIAQGGGSNTGVGTVYLQDAAGPLGSLILDNKLSGQANAGKQTQIEHVGRHEITAAADRGDGTWELSVGTTPWRVTDTQLQWGIQGLKVDLDASDEAGPIYTVESNTEDSLTITTSDDLSTVVGQELIGVHQFERLIIRDGAKVDFGGDRVEINDLAGSEVSDAIVRDLELTEAGVQYFATNNVDGTFELGDLSVATLSIRSPGYILQHLNVAGLLTLDTGLLVVETIEAQDLDIINGGVLTAPTPTLSGYTPLEINVTGEVYVDATSSIDVIGKGFDGGRAGPDNTTDSQRWGCHAGSRGRSNCTYGRYSRAAFAGSGGRTFFNQVDNGRGGGLVEIDAGSLVLDGTILAQAVIGGIGPSGAGGGVAIDVRSFSGVGAIYANGANLSSNYRDDTSSAASMNGGGGRISVYAEELTYSGILESRGADSGTHPGGAGTVYLRDTDEAFGSLFLDNARLGQTNTALTVIEHVGRHVITGVTDLGNGSWEVSVGSNVWEATNAQYEFGVQGLKVDLDASDEAGPIYTVESNTEDSLTITTSDDLSTMVGQELIGVHQFERLIIRDGAKVDFGGDRVEINDLAGSEVSDAIVRDLELTEAGVQYFATNNVDGTFELGDLSVATLSIRSPGYILQHLNVAGLLTLDTGLLVVETIEAQDLDIINGGVLTAPTPTLSGYTPLEINVTGEVYVDATSSIDVIGKGFDRDRYGPDNATSLNGQQGCHGGKRGRASSDCGYGRYARARFAGSGAERFFNTTDDGRGGGFVSITADTLLLDGLIRALGNSGGQGVSSAGGGVSIDVRSFNGIGGVYANGASRSFNYNDNLSFNGGGGRVSVYAQELAYSGVLQARGADAGSYPAGAGTVYLRDTDELLGSLIVDNHRPGQTGASSMVIEHVGRHVITGVTDLGNGSWEVSVGSNVWEATNAQYEFGVQGLKVDLDASDEAGPIYTVESNTEDSLTITTSDDLSTMVGQELIGVHQFERLIIRDGAEVDFGGDRVEINDLAGSEVSDAIVRDLELTEAGVQYFAANNVDGVIQLGIYVGTDLSVSNPGLGVQFEELILSGKLIVDGAVFEVPALISLSELDVLNGGVLTVSDPDTSGYTPLLLDVSGDVYVDATSSIDLTGKGFDGGLYGPDNTTASATPGCHGGNLRTVDDRRCVYGRYAKASFAGSGGLVNTNQPGEGGGYLSLEANQLVLDGQILANGVDGWDYGGAGGGIAIDVATLTGVGEIEAVGIADSFSSGGGRISVYAGDLAGYTGTFLASGGDERAGAGTIYIQDKGEALGTLIVDNNSSGTALGETHIESVGRHTITGVTDLGNGAWQLIIGTNDWRATNTELEYGIQGLKVDLDASNITGPIYTVDSNTENTLNVLTMDNLSSFVGQELIGVHQFETLTVKDGVKVDFGGDRIEVNDIANSSLSDAMIQNQDTLSNFP